jgi:hypothetical protein
MATTPVLELLKKPEVLFVSMTAEPEKIPEVLFGGYRAIG